MPLNNLLDIEFDSIISNYEKDKLPVPKKIRDGIINEEVFLKQEKRILFICKDHNSTGDYEEGDARKWMNDYVNYNFSHRIAEWSHGILNNFPNLYDINEEQKLQALRSIAFINLKKASGVSSINGKELYTYYTSGFVHLQKQIQIINPTIIICCLGWDGYIKELLTDPEEIFIGRRTHYKKGETIALNYYHPSFRASKEKSYKNLSELLKQVSN